MANETKPIYVTQARTGVYSGSSSVGYRISTIVKRNADYSGDPRDGAHLLNLFVNNIIDEDDSNQDTFSNYATLADLSLIAASRDEAIVAGSNKYRDSTNILTFDTLGVATSAAKVVRDTINNIVDTYLRVKNSFIGQDTHYFPYPEELSSLRDQYIQSYLAGKGARLTAEDAQEEAQVAYNNALIKEECIKDYKEKICALKDILNSAQTLVQLVGSKYKDTFTDVIDAAIADGTNDIEGASNLTDFKTWLAVELVPDLLHDSTFIQAVDSDSGTGLSLMALILQASSLASVSCATAGNELLGAEAQSASELSDLKEKQKLKEAAAQVEEATLATLATYCPNLDPATI